MGTFAFFLAGFAFFIVSFGLGFFIIFNDQERDEGDTNFFAYPFLTVIKTSAMFVGELASTSI